MPKQATRVVANKTEAYHVRTSIVLSEIDEPISRMRIIMRYVALSRFQLGARLRTGVEKKVHYSGRPFACLSYSLGGPGPGQRGHRTRTGPGGRAGDRRKISRPVQDRTIWVGEVVNPIRETLASFFL